MAEDTLVFQFLSLDFRLQFCLGRQNWLVDTEVAWRMLEFLVQRVLFLHSPPVLLLRGLRVCEFCNAKLGSNSVGIAYFTQNWLVDTEVAWRMLEFLVQRVLFLHSPPVLLLRGLRVCEFCNAKLGSNPVGIAYFTQNWLVDIGEE